MSVLNEKLGKTTNLLYGYNPSWLTDDVGNNGLFSVPGKPLDTSDINPPSQKGHWGFPTITLNDTAEDLLNNLFPYKINDPSCPTNTGTMDAGPLLINNKDKEKAMDSLSQTLGVDLSVHERGYVLVKIKRFDGTMTHSCIEHQTVIYPNPARIPPQYGVRNELLRAMAALKRVKPQSLDYSPETLTVDEANKYLNIFSQQGTHFISKVDMGDCIFQVYAMPKARYERVKKTYSTHQNMLSGPEAVLFRNNTTNANTGAFGYVAEYGHILSFSSSTTLKQAVTNGEWKENTFAETNSLFAAFQESSKIDLNANYLDVTRIETDLTSLTLFAEHNRRKLWRRVFKGALIQIFNGTLAPNFVKYCNYDLADKLSQGQLPGFLSVIATPTIDTYRSALNFKELEFVAPEEVKSFTLYSNLFENSGKEKIQIPGTDIVISGHMFSLENESFVSVLEVADNALDNLSISCRSFYGALLVSNASGSKYFTLMDGLRFDSNDDGPDGRRYAEVTMNIKQPPNEQYLARLTASLQFNYTFVQGCLNALVTQSDDTFSHFLRESLLWMTQIIPSDTQDKTLLDLRVRSLNLAHIERNQSLGAFVPVLPYTEYQQQINTILSYVDQIDHTIESYHQQVETRRTQELIINVGKDLNKNIIESGKLLSGYVEASVSQQKSLSDYYSSLIQQKENEQTKLRENISDLQSRLDGQRANVDTAVTNYKQGVQDWKTMESVKFGLTVATDIFSLGTSIMIPASSISAVKDLGLLAQRVQKLLNVLNATSKLFTDIDSGITQMQGAQDAFDNVSETLSADLDWDELSIQLDLTLATGPNDPEVNRLKAELNAAFKTLVLRGKALTNAKSQEQQNGRDIYDALRQRQLIDAQTNRLSALNTNLNPASIQDLDRNKIDLIGLTGQLSMVRSQTLGILAETFSFQDQSLQYATLQPATPIKNFDVLGIRGALVQQQINRTAAETELRRYGVSTTSPIEIVVQIPTQELRENGIYQFNLLPDNHEFYKYVNLRVKGVVAKIEGIKSTNSGSYLVNLAYVGRPFTDRAIDRDTVVFNTLSRQRTYAYKVKGNKPTFTDQGESWSDGVNPITPFSTWEISLPKSETNKGIVFEDITTTISLSFVLNARIHDARAARVIDMESVSKRLRARRSTTEPQLALATTSQPSEQTLLGQMASKSVLNNWDVVFNMAISKINSVLKSQYQFLKSNDSQYGGKISATTSIAGAPIGTIKSFVLQKFNLQYGYPQLEFLVNEAQTGNLEMEISQGTVQKGSKYIGELTDRAFMEALATQAGQPTSAVKEETIDGEQKLVLEYYEAATPLGITATLSAVIKMSQVTGAVEDKQNVLSVVLDMAQGSFSAKDIQIEMNDEQKVAFSEAVKAYFVNHPVLFIINSLDLSDIATLSDLKPSGFLFKAFESQGGNQMLQMFIQTNGRHLLNYSQTYISTEVQDPIPLGSETSLMINSRILFDNILPQSITTGWTLNGVNPGNNTDAWRAKFTDASIQANVDLSKLNSSYTPPFGTSTTYKSYAPYGGNPVTWSISGMSIASNRDGTMRLSYNKKNPFYYESSTKVCNITCLEPSKNKGSTDVTLIISAGVTSKITGSGRDQGIAIAVSQKTVDISGRTSGGGPCGSDDLQAQINSELKAVVPRQITSKIKFSFDDVSVFALKNLLFPSENYINLKKVYVPGDLLILGDFTTET